MWNPSGGVVLLILLIFERLIVTASLTTPNVNIQDGVLTYSREELINLSHGINDRPPLPEFLKEIKRSRRRGRRGGVRARCRRRGTRLPVPMVVCGNVRSIRNKFDELHALVNWSYAYREASMLCFTETWLQEGDPDTAFTLDGFTLIRGDRSREDTGKSLGGGLCAYVNNKWSNNTRKHNHHCDTNIELLTIAIRPYYLPREFSCIYVTIVYIPPDGDVKAAESKLVETVHDLENNNPDTVILITGDFNECKFDKCIPTYKQYISFPTRGDKLLDPFYCNIKSCYHAKKLSPLGVSDHNMCHLIPSYKTKLKRSKPIERSVYDWNEDVINEFIGCMKSTNFEALYDDNSSVEENVDVLTGYFKFCTDLVVPCKSVKCYNNNKPWVTKDLKVLLNKKKSLIASKDKEQLRSVQKEINNVIAECKNNYKNKIERLFKSDSRSAWQGLKQLTGMSKPQFTPQIENAEKFCNDLNSFYARFDKHDFSVEREDISCHLVSNNEHDRIVICENEVRRALKSIKINKAPGPDGIGPNILKMCSDPLTPVLCKIYQQSLDQVNIPKLWKTSEIIPVPKRSPPKCDNDYRPVALTAILMKCFEKVVKNRLQTYVSTYTDPYQFAYACNRCVDDATLALTDYVLEHLDNANTTSRKYYSKILFIDFSSAFNTIQPHIMMKKLGDMKVHLTLVLWIREFLTQRPQYVKYVGAKSDVIHTNTGAPQGCVLSPMLFTLYTSDCRTKSNTCQLFKYADDTALAARCINKDDDYKKEVVRFTDWCTENFLELNVSKTKEMIVDFRQSSVDHSPLLIGDQVVERVTEYKYLGTILDNKFTFAANINCVYKKVCSRIYFIRQLRKLKVDGKILDLFYTSTVSSVISFSISCWFGNSSQESQRHLTRVINTCSEIGVNNTKSLDELYRKSINMRRRSIIKDKQHPLNSKYRLLKSGRRWRSARCRTERYGKSFVPASIRAMNADKKGV